MTQILTFTNILCNVLDRGYTSDQAVEDLARLMNEATLLEIQGKADSPRFAELKSIIAIQEKLAKAKLDGHPIFEQLGTLAATPHKDD